ncbi:MAG: recombinase family protein [Lachnospiraceae bacterium]
MRARVGIYGRLSEEDKDKINKEDESESIQNQKRMLIEYALKNDWDIVDIYIDEDYSGAGVYRPEFDRMIKDCENKKIDIVLCKSQSRFSRDMEIIERYINNKFKEWNIRFISLVDNIDTDKSANKKSIQILGLTNEWYLEDLSDNIKRTIRSKKEAGQFTGSFAPYGYKRSEEDKHKLVVDPVASLIVKKIFEMYRNGNGYTKIATYLNNTNVPSPYEYKKANGSKFVCGNLGREKSYWYSDTIAKMLKDEVYIGNLVQGKTKHISYKNKKSVPVPKKDWIIVKNTHEPIIDMDTWNIVSAKFQNRAKPKKNGEIHMFSRKVYCECCKKIFYAGYSKSGNGNIFQYLTCKSRKSGVYCENNLSIRVDKLEQFILNEINEYIKVYYNSKTLNEKYQKLNTKNNKNEIQEKMKTLEKEKQDLERTQSKKNSYLKKLYEDRIDGFITDDQYRAFCKEYDEELKELQSRIDLLNDEITSLNQKHNDMIDRDKIFSKYKQIKKLDKNILDDFIERIYIGAVDKETNEREINIVWAI